MATPESDNFLRLLEARRSVRKFSPRRVTPEEASVLERAFMLAPQAGGNRGLRCFPVTDESMIRAMAETGRLAYGERLAKIGDEEVRSRHAEYGEDFFWFFNAPFLLVAVVRRPPLYFQEIPDINANLVFGGHLSAAMAVHNALLAAQTLGLGGCCLGGPMLQAEEIGKLLGLDHREELSLLAAVGEPAERRKA
ncbi:MAG: nitroreductase family protein [Deltaproteobacteria bacterium]|jgi:nitroreductase|nr:nitroreductase family protein [Deltaproteobacteria bacterium]